MSEVKDNTNREKHIVKARKLLELSKRGVGGEKTNSQNKFKEHMEKYGLEMGEIDASSNTRKFRVKSLDDLIIITNVILSVNPFTQTIQLKDAIKVDLDNEDYFEVIEKFKYFSKLHKIEKQLLMDSFFHKHKDFFQPDERTRTKWRDKHQVNKDLQKAQLRVDKMENKLSKADQDKMSKELEAHIIKMKRMEGVSRFLLNAEYARKHQTIGEK